VRFNAAARALCGFKPDFGGVGEVGDGRAEPGPDAALSEDVDSVRGPIGTVKLLRLRLGVEVPEVPPATGCGMR
jgi:hypothetical protein